jgi:hypothetical protein
VGQAAPAQFRAFQPVEHEQRRLNASKLLERQVELNQPAIAGTRYAYLVYWLLHEHRLASLQTDLETALRNG